MPAVNPLNTAFALAAIVLSGWPDHAAAMEYRIAVGERPQQLDIELCFSDGEAPRRLVAADTLSDTLGSISARLADGSSTPLELRGGAVAVPTQTIACVAYAVDARNAVGADWRSDLTAHNGALELKLNRVLLRPDDAAHPRRTRLHFSIPAGMSVSAPGRRLAANDGQVSFELLERPAQWPGTIAIGRLEQHLIEAGGAHIRLSIVGANSADSSAIFRHWVTAGIEAVAKLYGRFPISDLQLLVFSLPRNADPVPWGEVLRGGGDAVHLYVDATRSAAELDANWVLTHELSHLIHPYVSAQDAWLPEGLASYFQNVLRARAGLLDERAAWQKLDAGFKRGRAQFSAQYTLARDTRALMRKRQYMRVYWSGAAIALIGDVNLRRRSQGAMSLDLVFDEIARCCLPSTRRWPARELLAKMDAIAGFEVFLPLYDRYVLQPTFPDLEETYRALGLRAQPRQLEFSGEKTARSLRTAIMRGF